MSRLEWLRRTLIESGASLLQCSKSYHRNGMRRRKATSPCVVEGLEDRTLLTTFVVNTTSDDADDAAGVADGLISLREAIIAANTNAAFGDAPAGMVTGDTISFDTNVFNGSEAARTINLQNGRYTITDDLRITGVAPNVILDAGGGSRIFRVVTNQVVSMSDLTLRNAVANDGTGGGAMRLEGGGRTFLSRVIVENSSAVGRGGAVLVVNSTLETFDSQFVNNQAGFGGGLASVLGVVTLNHTLVDGNTSTGEGGGLSNDGGRLILRNSVISNNKTNVGSGLRGGGGVHNLNTGRLAVSASDIINNSAANSRGGGIYSSSGTITIGSSTISGNFAAQSGGGIELVNGDLTLTSSLLGGLGGGTGNVAGNAAFAPANGGGLHVSGPARAVVEGSLVQFNEATGEGGGLWNSQQGTLIVRRPPAVVTSITEGIAASALTLTPTVDAFRTTLGTNNGGIPGSLQTGRREVSFDDAPDSQAAPNLFTPDFYNNPLDPQARGIELSTPGQGFQLSATDASLVGTQFSNLNPTYTQVFSTFSDERLLTPIGSNVTVVDFFVPGTNIPAAVRGFGAVFSDVDLAGATTIEYFDVDGELLLSRSVSAVNFDAAQSFLGVTFAAPVIAQVRITTGTGPIGPNDITQGGTTDVVVLDDFIYGEPVSLQSVAMGSIIRGNKAHGDAADNGGGGIFNNGGLVVIDDSTIEDNLADGMSGSGGGIFSTGGQVIVNDTVISGNEAARAGGGIELVSGQVSLNDVTLGGTTRQDGNAAGLLPFGPSSPGNGGGLHVSGNGFVRVTGGSVQNNVAVREGGGLWNSAGGIMIVQGGTQIADNVALGNAADDGGGGIFNNGGRLVVVDSTISGNSAQGTSGSGGGLFSTGGAVTLTNTVFDDNAALRAGGGIEVVTGRIVLQDVSLTNNSAGNGATGAPGNGGGLHVTGAARVDITGGLIEGNSAANEGGGLWNSANGLMILFGGTAIRNNIAFGNDPMDGGGGIFNNGGRLAIASAEISGNRAFGPNTTGGGLLSIGGNVTIVNSTISGNTANSAGGGISNFGTLLSTNNTIVMNVSNPSGARVDAGGIFTGTGGLTLLRNTIVAGNQSRTQAAVLPRLSDLGGPGRVGAAFSLIGDSNSAAGIMDGVGGNIVGMLGEANIDVSEIVNTTLVDNGGATSTHALRLSSLALNNGSNALAIDASGRSLQFDQRGPGFNRIFNNRVDIGAYER